MFFERFIMHPRHVTSPVKYVHSHTNVYHSSKIDLRWHRSIHSCFSVCSVTNFHKHGLACGAVHYGFCAEVSEPAAQQKQHQHHKAVTTGNETKVPGQVKPIENGTLPAKEIEAQPMSPRSSTYAKFSTINSLPTNQPEAVSEYPAQTVVQRRLQKFSQPQRYSYPLMRSQLQPINSSHIQPMSIVQAQLRNSNQNNSVQQPDVITNSVIPTDPEPAGLSMPTSASNQRSSSNRHSVPVLHKITQEQGSWTPKFPVTSNDVPVTSKSVVTAELTSNSSQTLAPVLVTLKSPPSLTNGPSSMRSALTIDNGVDSQKNTEDVTEKQSQLEHKLKQTPEEKNKENVKLVSSGETNNNNKIDSEQTANNPNIENSQSVTNNSNNRKNLQNVNVVVNGHLPATPATRSLTSPRNPNFTPPFPKDIDLISNLGPHTVNIPQFYFPMGRPLPSEDSDSTMHAVEQEFASLEGGKAFKQNMASISKACGLPVYWKVCLFRAAGGEKQGYITLQMFTAMWNNLVEHCHDNASRFMRLVAKPGSNSIDHDDFMPLVQDAVETHPGLGFLLEAPEFHSRYVNTVIARIFYCVNSSWSGRITLPELRRSNFLQVLASLEDEEDINQVTDFFSYEHFYVIYCKFWELDRDHDLFIDKNDLARHNEHAISSRVIDRVFSGAVTRGPALKENRMSYPEFVCFLISEEDKRFPRSIEYWFRVMDLDGDGVLSMYEMEYFYEEQMQRMEALGIERLPFSDALCQMFDLVKPRRDGKITLSDLKASKLTNIFFDTFINLDKFLDHEQRDPFANVRDLETDDVEISDWDRYAAEEYENLVAEEGANEQDEIHYEDDFEADDDMLSEEMVRLSDPPVLRTVPGINNHTDDIYDFGSAKVAY